MVEPITVSLILSLAVSIGMVIMLSMNIIRNGKDVTNSFSIWIKDKLYQSLTIRKNESLPGFIGLCIMFNTNRNKIKCHSWRLVTLTDKYGKNKTFNIPESDKVIELNLKNRETVIIRIISNSYKNSEIEGFQIYYKSIQIYKEFINNTLTGFISDEDLNSMLTYQ